MSDSQPNRLVALKLLLAWAFVGIPLAWGIMQTIEKAMKLFR